MTFGVGWQKPTPNNRLDNGSLVYHAGMAHTACCHCRLTRHHVQGAGQMTGIVVAFYADLQPLREDGLVRVVQTIAPLAAASEVLPVLSAQPQLLEAGGMLIWPSIREQRCTAQGQAT